ncbi:hypothetical protein RIF29_34076 [Crotalaria pallida]|uniref:MaoC-like domain-containing protein n=1 Tax=Crotalaria pallida TaxID=3830 RepID=A0AAN9HX75_CROPI
MSSPFSFSSSIHCQCPAAKPSPLLHTPVETKSYDKESGDLLCMNRMTVYLRGAGGFSKSSKPFSYSNYPSNQISSVKIPESKPFSVFEDHTQPSQALLYRLSGDYNPLHSDPMFAKAAGLVLLSYLLSASKLLIP